MDFRTILLVVGVEQDDAEIDRAVRIAEGLGAHLSVLVLGVAPPPPSSPYGVVSNDIWANEIRDGQDLARKRAEAIEARLAGRDLSFSMQSQYVDRGTIATLVARFARYADLTLITPERDDVELAQSWVINGALFESGRPVLLLPRGETAFPTAKRIMIAWDASVEASKAVLDAIGLMREAEAVYAVLIDPVPSFEGHGPEPGADLGAYLARHGINIDVRRLPKEGKDVAELLQRVAVDLGADLIVMGGFGHSRLRQRIFGGTTTSTIRQTDVPVLMAH
ncbi:universal stress protein [Amaricoccus sp.]|uniref:universal stress protein n=1 Tax=Amaricoccus sp. TaxID=1872485 RepID=UPI001B3EDE2C|nr:universal stress protein [Amaricoccus sp.]MBP7242781.1 universal stress protein [Amaricoccus sp.]